MTSLLGMVKGRGPSGFGFSSTAEDVSDGLDLTGKTYVVTGANSGLGLETVRVLGLRGATVIALARTDAKARGALAEAGATGHAVACELSEPASVRDAVQRVIALGLPIDALIANAGIMALPERTVQHGVELQLLTNHFGHFILVNGLLEQLADDGRIVMLSSSAHRGTYRQGIRLDDFSAQNGYSSWGAYGQSKLANLLFAKQLATRLPKPGQRAVAVHPGVIATNLGRHSLGGVIGSLFRGLGPALFLKTVEQGTATQVWAAVHPDAYTHQGVYMADCNVASTSRYGSDMALAGRLWDETERTLAAMGV